MNLILKKKNAKKTIRQVVLDDRALSKAAKASIKDQKKITTKAAKLRAQLAR